MKQNIIMFKDTVTGFEGCLRDPNAEWIGVGDIGGAPYRVYFLQQESKPRWLDFVAGRVDESKLAGAKTLMPGVLILLQVATAEGTRFFGLTQGSGHNLVERDCIELDFGLKTAMSAVNFERLYRADSRNVGGRTRQKRVVSSYDATLGALEYDFDSDIPQNIGGHCANAYASIGKRIDGADILHVTISKKDAHFDDLAAKCGKLFDLYRSDAQRRQFDFINIASVRDKATIAHLEAQLVDTLDREIDDGSLFVVCPDQIEQHECVSYEITGLGRRVETADPPALSDIYDYLRQGKNGRGLSPAHLRKVKITGYTEDDSRRGPHSLLAYSVFDTMLDGKRYVLTNQKWFHVDDCFLQKVEDRINDIREMTTPAILDWPQISRGLVLMHHEEDYNKLYAANPDFLVLDRNPFQRFGRQRGKSKVEFADLYHGPTKKLLCVKRWNGSATMSHLLAQASVSADLLRSTPAYREELFRQVKDHWPSAVFPGDALSFIDDLTFVYVIGTKAPAPRSLRMLPVFSQIHMLKHVKEIESRRFRVEIAWVSMV